MLSVFYMFNIQCVHRCSLPKLRFAIKIAIIGNVLIQLTNQMIFIFQLQEINTNDDKKVEFEDDKNQLIWFLQPQEAQFYLAAETLRHKPQKIVRTKLPFKPRRTSRMTRPNWPQIYEIQEYLSRLRAPGVRGMEGRSS